MSTYHESTGTVFIVDTTEYAGNFEREMCAWITGQTGDCGVGQLAANAAQGSMSVALSEWCEDNIRRVADDHGCARPATLWATPKGIHKGKGSFTSVGIYIHEIPPPAILTEMKERARVFCNTFQHVGGVPSRFSTTTHKVIPLTGFRIVKVRMIEDILLQESEDDAG